MSAYYFKAIKDDYRATGWSVCGPYDSRAAAESHAEQLRANGMKTGLVHPLDPNSKAGREHKQFVDSLDCDDGVYVL